jgi:hypothetical protein
MSSTSNRLNIYVIVGHQSEARFLEPLIITLKSRFEAEGTYVVVRTLNPYGSSKNIIKQLIDKRNDTHLYPEKADQSTGGRTVQQDIITLGAKAPIVLIGYGVGAVAAYHGAELLEKHNGCEIKFIVQIGSPKVPISPHFRNRVGFLTQNKRGINNDPLSWNGTWSHSKYTFTSHRYPGLLYNATEKGRRAYAPGNVTQVDITGQPTNYFSATTGIGSVSNLARTMNIIWSWVRP